MFIFSFLLCIMYFYVWAKWETLFGFAGELTTEHLCVFCNSAQIFFPAVAS